MKLILTRMGWAELAAAPVVAAADAAAAAAAAADGGSALVETVGASAAEPQFVATGIVSP